MPDFLLELFSEEIPARMQPAATAQLKSAFETLLEDAGLSADHIETHATPRRLALIARNLPGASAATSEERRGPKADAPAQAIEGFLKSTGLGRDQLETRDTGKGVFLFAKIGKAGRDTSDTLAEKLPALITGFQWPKSQRWGPASASTASPRWVRPLREIVALLDEDIIEFTALGVRSGQTTFGHRFMGDGQPLCIVSPSSYAQQLAAAYVILCANERRAYIREGAAKLAAEAGLTVRPDEALEAENAGLTEWPVPLLGHFNPDYLNVPPEIIRLTMRTNQKYFAVEARDGALAPAFICVANLEAPDAGKTIIAGNERVLSARLADARFFWEQDKAKTLEQHAEKLKDIVFHEKLGTMADKVERVAKLARWLIESGAIPPNLPTSPTQPVTPAKAGASRADLAAQIARELPASAGMTKEEAADLAERGARLAKADLTTATVGEFPELQGIVGGYLAQAQGEAPDVVSALKQQYAPVTEGCIPVAVVLADRADTIARFFGESMVPTGSKDPFALRRAMLGIINAIRNGGYRLPATSLFHEVVNAPIFDFLQERLRVQVRDEGIRADVIDATLFWGGNEDIVAVVALAKALQAFIETPDGANLLAGYKRAANILRIEEKKDSRNYSLDPSIPLSKYIGETEKNLAAFFVPAEGADSTAFFDEADALFGREDFAGAMKLLATLRAPVDAFFEHVTVNDADPAIRARRLGLLSAIRDAMHKIADFSKIEGA